MLLQNNLLMQTPRACKLILLQSSLLKHDTTWFDEIFFVDTWAQYHLRVHNGSNIAWKAYSQCLLQDIWVYERESGSFLSQWFQARPLYEDPSKVNVFSSGTFSSFHIIHYTVALANNLSRTTYLKNKMVQDSNKYIQRI